MNRVLCAALMLILPSLASGEDVETRFLLSHRNLKTLEAGFRQTITSPGLPRPIASEGRIFYEAPDRLRIDYARPAGDYFLLTGNRLEIVRRGKPPVIHNSTDPSARALVALREVLRGTPPVGDFQKQVVRAGGEFRVLLTPRGASPNLPRKIETRVEAQSLLLLGMTITMPQGSIMDFAFENPRCNEALDPGVFKPAE